ncbi:STE3-domain-containing protein [Gymnopus androsaceus JB14]|uniref:STE3-domain-containing protein n=1 Tax=Gymnopus androsaceus JB14 TaxID=1447944 RepID=A0A6A4GAY7_9AGAR|nr:STE3-domain-containing protein [Gymnopus androsaceus JB14]
MAATAGLPSCIFLHRTAAVRYSLHTDCLGHSCGKTSSLFLLTSLICVLGPLIYLSLQYIVQGHRFNIFEDIGCAPALYNSLPLYFITYSWSIIFGLASAVYCVLALRAFAQRRLEFAQFMSTNKTLTMGRYFRLMVLAMTEMLCTVPLSIVTIWFTATSSPIGPWISLSNTHFDFSRVDQYPSVIYEASPRLASSIQFNRWASVACALVFFALFGFAEEARRNYTLWYHGILHILGMRSPSPSPFTTSKKHKLPASLSIKLDSTTSFGKDHIPSSESSEPPVYDVLYPKAVFLGSPVRSSSDASSTVCSSPAQCSHFDSSELHTDFNGSYDPSNIQFATAI